MKKLGLLVLNAAFCFSAHAGITTAQIDMVMLDDTDNIIYVYPVGGVNNPLECDASGAMYFSFSATRSMAKEYLSLLLSAQVSGKKVDIWGKGVCTDISTSETLHYLRIKNK